MKSLMVYLGFSLIVSSSTSADEFADEVREIRRITEASTAERANVNLFIQLHIAFMVPAIKYQMAQHGQIASEQEIEKLLHQWRREYSRQIPQLAFETQLSAYKETFSLDELKEIKATLSSPLMRKFVTGGGIDANRLMPQLQTKALAASNDILDRLLSESPNWDVSGTPINQSGAEKSVKEGGFSQEWLKYTNMFQDQSDVEWSIMDRVMAELVIKHGHGCITSETWSLVSSQLPRMKQQIQSDFMEKISQTDEEYWTLYSEEGVALRTSPRAMLQAAFQATQDWTVSFLWPEVMSYEGKPNCDILKGWGNGLAGKANLIRSVEN